MTVHPLNILTSDFEPFLVRRQVDFLRFGSRVRQRGGRQACKGINHVDVVERRWRKLAAARQLQMAFGACAEQLPVIAVREEQFRLVDGKHRHRRVETFKHGREAFVRRREFFACALGLTDVRQRRHPARLAAVRIHERRDEHARVENRAVLALHSDFEAVRRRFAPERHIDTALHFMNVVFRPVRIGRRTVHQIRLVPARHPAKRRVHISNMPLKIEHSHADHDGIFHRATERRLVEKRLLRLEALTGVSPKAPQTPENKAGQPGDQPDQRVVDEITDGRIRIDAHRQTVSGGIEQQFVRHVPGQGRSR